MNQRNLQLLVTKTFKVYNDMASEILNVFKLRIMPCKLKNYDSIKSIEIKQLASVKSIKLKTKK